MRKWVIAFLFKSARERRFSRILLWSCSCFVGKTFLERQAFLSDTGDGRGHLYIYTQQIFLAGLLAGLSFSSSYLLWRRRLNSYFPFLFTLFPRWLDSSAFAQNGELGPGIALLWVSMMMLRSGIQQVARL